MFEEKINKKVLIAPLDWGLGHATRCIPIIKILLQKECNVLIAADGPHKVLLQEVFPQLEFLDLKGYGIRYATKNMLFHLAQQLPNFLKTVKEENEWLDKTIDEYGIDLVISDNRYGLWSTKIPCIFITHQLQLSVPIFIKWAEKIIQRRLYALVEKFSLCWIPDVANQINNLSGKLGHPSKMPHIPVRYIGPLSRFENALPQEKKYLLMVCLSGPEPQRSLFESMVLSQLKNIDGHVILVRGKPGSEENLPQEKNLTIVNHLSTIEMQQAFTASSYILSRCGYTTLMDMQALGCKCIYVPTPGQTEQEYLGKRLQDFGMAVVFKQHGFNLKKSLAAAEAFNYKFSFLGQKDDLLENEISQLIKNGNK